MLTLCFGTIQLRTLWAALAVSLALSVPLAHAQHSIALQTLPSFGLSDGQIVSAGVLFLSGGYRGVLEECAHLNAKDVCTTLEWIENQTSESSWTKPIRVEAIIATDAATVDCRLRVGADLCFVRVRTESFNWSAESAPFPLSFDPSKPLANPPSLEVRDAKGVALTSGGRPVRDAEVIRLSASRYPLRSRFVAVVCTVGEATPRCAQFASGSTGDTGTISLNLPWYAEFGTQPEVPLSSTYDWIDCHTASCQVELRVYGRKRSSTLTFPLRFEAAPPVARPVLEVTPNEDLISGQTVKVRGRGFAPNTEIQVIETMPNRHEDRRRATVTSASDGSFELEVVVLSDLWVDRGHISTPEIDCDVHGTCYVLAQESGGRRNFASVALTFLE